MVELTPRGEPEVKMHATNFGGCGLSGFGDIDLFRH